MGFITPEISLTAQSGTNNVIIKAVAVPAKSPMILDSGRSLIGLNAITIPITIRNVLVKWFASSAVTSLYWKLGGMSKFNDIIPLKITKIPKIKPK